MKVGLVIDISPEEIALLRQAKKKGEKELAQAAGNLVRKIAGNPQRVLDLLKALEGHV